MEEEASRSQVAKELRAYCLLVSLRQQKAIQSTVHMKDANSQTLVPQRNSVLESIRINTMGPTSTSIIGNGNGNGNGITNIESPLTASGASSTTLMLFPDTILEHRLYSQTDEITVQDLMYTSSRQLKLSKERRSSTLSNISGTATPSSRPPDLITPSSSIHTSALPTSAIRTIKRTHSFQTATGNGLPVLDGSTTGSSESTRKSSIAPLSGLLGTESSVRQLGRQQQITKKNSFVMPRKPSHSTPWNPSSGGQQDYSTAHRQRTSNLQNISGLHSEVEQKSTQPPSEAQKKPKKEIHTSKIKASLQKNSASRNLDNDSWESDEIIDEESSAKDGAWTTSSDDDSEGKEESDELTNEEEEVTEHRGTTANSSKSGTRSGVKRVQQQSQQKRRPTSLVSHASLDLSGHYRAHKKLDEPRDPIQSLGNPPSR
jgi:hypothetical protein